MIKSTVSERYLVPARFVLAMAAVLAALVIWQANDAARVSGPLHPAFQELQFKLGQFWLCIGEREQARLAFEHVLRNDPQAHVAHVALAVLAHERGHREATITHLRQALAINPELDEAHASLGVLLLEDGEIHEACDHFKAALATQSRHHVAMTNLAWVMATSADDQVRDGALALDLATRASNTLDDRDPKQLTIVAAAKAETGDFQGAMRVAEHALKLAQEMNVQDMAAAVKLQLEKYRAGQPLRFSSY